MSSGGVERLCQVIKKAVDMSKKTQPAELGEIRGDMVVVGNKVYPMTIAIDAPLKSGDPVWVQFTEGKGGAVVIGA